MFKFTRKPDPSEEERLAVAIARSLSLQVAAGGADSAGNNNPTTAQPGIAPESATPSGLNSPKIEIRRSGDAEDSSLAYLGDLDSDTPPSLPEFSMKVGNKTPDGVLITAELKSEWKRCIKEGRITDLEAKEMHYGDLVALLGPSRRVLLSRRQVEEIHEHSIITGKIVIISDGLIWYLIHVIKRQRHRIWHDKRRISDLEKEKARLEKEAAALHEKVEGLERVVAILQEEVKTLTCENERLTRAIDELTKTIKEQSEEIKDLQHRICELVKEVERWKHLYEAARKKEEKYRRLYKKCRRELHETRQAYEHRRQAITDILLKPLPGGHCEDDDDLSDDEAK